MESINSPVLFNSFPMDAHKHYARSVEYEQATQSTLPLKHTNSFSLPSTLSTASTSHLQDLPFFDCKTLSWSFFEKPPLLFTSFSYYFSEHYFSWVRKSAKKFQEFVKNRAKKQEESDDKAEKALFSLFELHENLSEIMTFIETRRTVQKA